MVQTSQHHNPLHIKILVLLGVFLVSSCSNEVGTTTPRTGDEGRADYLLPEAIFAVSDAIEQVLDIEVPDKYLIKVLDIKVKINTSKDMPEGIAGQAWCVVYSDHTKRGITLLQGMEDSYLKIVLIHEVLHHIANLLKLEGNWDHKAAKLWDCDDSVEAVASRLVGSEFFPAYDTEKCKIK
jgi:hypothetical protein